LYAEEKKTKKKKTLGRRGLDGQSLKKRLNEKKLINLSRRKDQNKSGWRNENQPAELGKKDLNSRESKPDDTKKRVPIWRKGKYLPG